MGTSREFCDHFIQGLRETQHSGSWQRQNAEPFLRGTRVGIAGVSDFDSFLSEQKMFQRARCRKIGRR